MSNDRFDTGVPDGLAGGEQTLPELLAGSTHKVPDGLAGGEQTLPELLAGNQHKVPDGLAGGEQKLPELLSSPPNRRQDISKNGSETADASQESDTEREAA